MLSGIRSISSNRLRAVGPKSVSSDRRSHDRLRDLCDEVLASHRAASGRDVISEADRVDARLMLARIAPLAAR